MHRSHIFETKSFAAFFGPKAQRNHPCIDASTFEGIGRSGAAASGEATKTEATVELAEGSTPVAMEHAHVDYIEPIYAKGTSRRICGELYKVIDWSDVLSHILDARDPLGTLCESVLEYIRKESSRSPLSCITKRLTYNSGQFQGASIFSWYPVLSPTAQSGVVTIPFFTLLRS